ncbi:FMN reductase [Methylobacterium indicum]|uniref:FMN reductase n=1 Tax=Methylobacterium indicum TaxID=1775910 RepID=A0A0J6RAW3_9HYPH|nr:FMN reductase [Methylobacterium indicum]KMO18479.1 FMN reductase [Methylobacterium indicum]KMO25697.1 FMN reductase [Methylobacterium indicum]KTS20825.1 FMN reductase [Methylobacterium indicum]KTS24874.1 FMN reductase [Methylobacterium indicum]KTS48104.1 FMN reductase [Methylobacterium indicum]
MRPARIVAFSGNVRRPSRTRVLVEAVAAELGRRRPIDLKLYDLAEVGTGLGATSRQALPLPIGHMIEAMEGADGLIVGSPVYNGSYSGLFKHVIDFLDPAAIAGKPVVLTATGGGPRHALMVEHQLRPLFGFFTAHVAPTAVYAGEAEIEDGAVSDPRVAERVAAAAAELGHLLDVAEAARRAGSGRAAAGL